ncbi:MAG: DNA primase [Rubrivivax sp.]
MIPAGFLQDLLSRVDIVDVVGRHVELKRGGANLMGLCPFHAEKSPSFSVSPSKQFYYCFGCGASGDAIRFLTEHTGMSFVDAVTELAQGVGMQVPQEQVSPEERERRQRLSERRLSLTELLQKAARHYRAKLRESPEAIAYLKRRGLSGEIAARFGLGYAPPGWRGLASVFASYDDPLLEEAGLVRSPDDGDETPAEDRKRYDWFRHRIMFPIRAVGGEVIGFGARVLDDSKPKYLNSPETPVFSKGRELYGLFEARQAIRERGHALVVEGYMDVVALAQHGFGNAVATLGTACTGDHIQKLFRFTDSIVFSFDGDDAGRRAAARALEAALPHATELRQVRFLFLPPEHDPDSFVRELGAQAFEQALAQAVPLSRQLIEQAAQGQPLELAEGRARFLAQARPLWQAMPAGALRDQLLGEIAQAARMAREELAASWGHGGAAAAPGAGAAAGPRRSGPPPRRSAPRVAARLPQDRAAALLLQRCEWWEQLSGDDHELLAGLADWHGELFRWIDRWVAEHGATPWSSLREWVAAEAWGEAARTLVDGAEVAVEPVAEDLQAALGQIRFARRQQAAWALLGRR